MNINFYKIISAELTEAIDKSYKAGIASVIKKNKKLLAFSEPRDPFKIDYTGTDHIAIQNFKIEAFTVAGVMTYELEEKLKTLALDLQEGRHPLAKGEKDINKVFIDEAYNIIGDYIQVEDLPPPGYLQTNLRTAITSSYHAAQYIRLQDPVMMSLYPAYEYFTMGDNRVRESHKLLDGLIFYADDPIWDRIMPVNDFNCRCGVKPLDVDEIKNLKVEDYTTPERRDEIVKEGEISKNFDRNSGQVKSIWGKWLDSKFKDLNYYELLKKDFINYKPIDKKIFTDYKKAEINHEIYNENMIRNVMDHSDEVWAKTYTHNGIVNSEINFIKLKDDGFELVKMSNNEIRDFNFYDISKIDEYRKGVLLI